MEHTGSSALQGPVARRTLIAGTAGVLGALSLGAVTATPAQADQQTGWRWCNRCQCLFYGDNYTTGWCCRGGGHNYRGSGTYEPNYDYDSGQDDWRWCHKCQSCWYAGNYHRYGRCPAGGGHSGRSSYNYSIEYGSPGDDEQSNWYWCRKCYCLYYGGYGNGYCPSGGRHDHRGSANYYLPYE